ncbi:MAG TPA: ATP-binding protein [Bauldia sp.]
MRRLLPDSLTAWALLILIGGLILAEVATLGTIQESREANSRMTSFFHIADRVSSISRAIAAEDVRQRASLATELSGPTLAVSVDSMPLTTSTVASDDELAELEDILSSRLEESGVTDVHVEMRDRDLIPASDTGGPPGADAGPVERVLSEIEDSYNYYDAYIASVRLADGTWVNFISVIAPSPLLWSTNTVAVAILAIVLIFVAAVWALRRLTAPYAMIASAAERFGRDLGAGPLPEQGPSEVRAAAHAFNLMQERLKRFFSDRDQLVAAISHDLRTPATRLRLRAEFIDDPEQRSRMLDDLNEIETMTRSVLAFASDSAQPEPRESLDLVSLLESLCDDMPDVDLDLPAHLPRLAYAAQPVALRRCIANILDNAVKYGHRARVSLKLDSAAVHIVVDDDGPGIPEGDVEMVFQPFRRLDASRNRDTGGTGLGLTIARTVARAHGGEITLTNRREGGLRAEIILPIPGGTAARKAA